MKFHISPRAYAKILLHTSKYPHKAVNGVLLGDETLQDGEVYVLDAVPLFHICLGLAPMLEVALARVDMYCKESGQQIVGYYQANEHIDDNSPNAICYKIGEKLCDQFNNGFILMMAPFRWPSIQNDLALAKEVASRKPQTHQDWDEIATVLSEVFSSDSNRVDLKGRGCQERLVDNTKLSVPCEEIACKCYVVQDSKWKQSDKDLLLDGGEDTLSLTTDLLEGKAYQSLIDFDNHLDDITQDWLNKDINRLVDISLAT